MLDNKTVLITGGTGTLGEECVKRALNDNARVFFTYHSNHEKAGDLEKKGAHAISCDLSSADGVSSLITHCIDNIDSIDVLINNSAIVRDHIIVNMTEEEWDTVIMHNIKAVISLSYGLLPLIKKGTAKKVFNIISRVGMTGGVGQANYAASKDALIEFTKVLAIEWAEYGIIVNGINPGFMESAMTNVMPDPIKTLNKDKSVLHTFSSPHEVAAFIAHLCSDTCKRISGQILHYETRITH